MDCSKIGRLIAALRKEKGLTQQELADQLGVSNKSVSRWESGGYPESYGKGYEITMTEAAAKHTYVAGAALKDGVLVTSGGRVTGTTAVADSLADAIKEAYRLADGVQFENAYRRSDIGQRALLAGK